MKVLAKDLYSTLRESIGPELKGAGLRRLKMGMLGWTRPFNDKHLSLWFQCDRWGWFPAFGSSFTIEFQIDRVTGIGGNLMHGRERFMPLLTIEEREIVRAKNNRIVSEIPALESTHPVAMLSDKLREGFMWGYRTQNEPYALNEDVWLHYRSPGDVSEWAEFFRPRIVRMVEQFEREYPRKYES